MKDRKTFCLEKQTQEDLGEGCTSWRKELVHSLR